MFHNISVYYNYLCRYVVKHTHVIYVGMFQHTHIMVKLYGYVYTCHYI